MAPRMSRTLPAALYGNVDTIVFQAFCDRMDDLFKQLDTEQRRRKNRFWWTYGALNFWLLFSIFAPLLFDSPALDDADTELSISVPLCVCILHICAIWVWTARPSNTKTDAETIRDIRLECEEMSNRSPFVSFQIVFMPVPTIARGGCLFMNTVDHIVVSVSTAASLNGAAADAVIDTVTDKHYGRVEAIPDISVSAVHAKAVENGDYQQLV